MSEVDICNLALAHLGDTANIATIKPPDGSIQAEHAARFYPQARDSLLELHNWGFATTFTAPALLVNSSSGWSYAYALPSDTIKVLGVAPSGEVGSLSLYHETAREEIEAFGHTAWWEALFSDNFEVVGGAIYTNQQSAVFVYTKRITDPTKFPPLFVRALSWLLASDLAGPILKGAPGEAAAKRCLEAFLAMKSMAVTSDANQRSGRRAHSASWISGR